MQVEVYFLSIIVMTKKSQNLMHNDIIVTKELIASRKSIGDLIPVLYIESLLAYNSEFAP